MSGKPIFDFVIGLNAGAKRRTSSLTLLGVLAKSDLGTDDADHHRELSKIR